MEGAAEPIGGHPVIVISVLIVEVPGDGAVTVGMTGADVSVDEARMPRFEVCIDDATVQMEVNGPPAEMISTLEPGLG